MFHRLIFFARSPLVFLFVVAFCVFSYYFLDRPVAIYVETSLNARVAYIAGHITHLGEGTLYYVALASMFLFFKFILKRKVWENIARFLFLAVLIPGLLCTVLKTILGRARPVLFYSEHIYGFTFFRIEAPYLSFPSGHSVLISSVMIGLCFIFTRYCPLFIILALCISMSRVLIGAHYLSDVVAGMYLSVLVVPWIYEKMSKTYGIQDFGKKPVLAC